MIICIGTHLLHVRAWNDLKRGAKEAKNKFVSDLVNKNGFSKQLLKSRSWFEKQIRFHRMLSIFWLDRRKSGSVVTGWVTWPPGHTLTTRSVHGTECRCQNSWSLLTIGNRRECVCLWTLFPVRRQIDLVTPTTRDHFLYFWFVVTLF